jgi:hypothetical protein
MELVVRYEGEASPAVQSDYGVESEPLLSDGESCNSSDNYVIYVDAANEESNGNDESLPLLQSSSSEVPLHCDPLKRKAPTYRFGSTSSSSNKSTGECRICQETAPVELLDTPCACTGSMLYVHKGCIQHWINDKGDTTCEVCHKNFEGDYKAPPTRATSSGLIRSAIDAPRVQRQRWVTEPLAAVTEPAGEWQPIAAGGGDGSRWQRLLSRGLRLLSQRLRSPRKRDGQESDNPFAEVNATSVARV